MHIGRDWIASTATDGRTEGHREVVSMVATTGGRDPQNSDGPPNVLPSFLWGLVGVTDLIFIKLGRAYTSQNFFLAKGNNTPDQEIGPPTLKKWLRPWQRVGRRVHGTANCPSRTISVHTLTDLTAVSLTLTSGRPVNTGTVYKSLFTEKSVAAPKHSI